MQIIAGDSLAILPTISDNSIDAIVTDPPYGLKFMGRKWDYELPSIDIWRECLRVLKPGGYMVAFGGCRTYHRLATAIEDAGFILHPMLAWAFGSGFPKATNASKMIDKADGRLGAITPNTGKWKGGKGFGAGPTMYAKDGEQIAPVPHTPRSPEAAQWEGWYYGLQSLKPALEPICMAQKPMIGTGAQNILKHGTGGINVDASRVGSAGGGTHCSRRDSSGACLGHPERRGTAFGLTYHSASNGTEVSAGRWPPNLLHDGSEEVVECFPQSKTGDLKPYVRANVDGYSGHMPPVSYTNQKGDEGSAARFFPSLPFTDDERRVFYCAKASRKDRAGSTHPTVKPIKLMEWLCKLITPPGGTILDPFAGSGTTGAAARNCGFDFILIEREAEYVEDIVARFSPGFRLAERLNALSK